MTHRRAAALSELPPAVRRMWLLERLDPGPGLHVQTSLRIVGSLAPTAVPQALEDVARRHRALRTRFPSDDGCVGVVTDPSIEVPLARVDLRPRSDDSDERLRQLAAEEARRRFDLEAGPLARCLLARLGEDEHHLLLLCHHTIADRRAAAHLARDLIDILCSETGGEQAEPCAVTSLEALRHEVPPPRPTSRLVESWSDRLAGAPIALDLPTDRARPSRLGHIGASAHATLDAGAFASLGALARTSGTTRFVVVLAAWAAVLQELSGCDDVVAGTHLAAPDGEGPSDPVTCSMNTVPLRVDVSGAPSFRALVERCRDAADHALASAALPFDVLVDQLGIERDGSRNPCFQVDYTYWGAPEPSGASRSLTVSGTPLDLDVALLELGLAADADASGGLSLRVDSDVDLFHPTTGRSLVHRVRDLLLAAADAPDRPVSDLTLIDGDACAELLRLGRGPALEAPVRAVTTLFAERAAAAPDAPAVRRGRAVTTYGQLATRVDAVAAALGRRGIGPGSIVGVSVSRPEDWLAADLGVMESGAAFAPLDPAMPVPRRRAAVAMAGIELVVTDVDPAGWAPCEVVGLVDLEQAGGTGARSSGRPAPAEDSPAYVVFTSGSTGAPKPVVVTVGNLAASNAAHLARYQERVWGVISIHEPVFDAWIGMALWTLTAGGALVVPDDDQRRDPRRIGTAVEGAAATHMTCLPSYWRMVLDRCPTEQLASLTTVIVGSEASPRDLVRRHHEVLGPQVVLHDEYGPTEATVWCTAREQRDDHDRPPASIGRPIAGAHAYVVDPALRLVLRGMPGELLIGGAGVAAGYLGHPELTAERFVDDPFRPGGRAYRTGDRVRWLPDGSLQLLGRGDGQVKLRGRRIELGEVEAALLRHRRVDEAVAAVVPGPGPGGGSLVAWVTGASGDDAEEALRQARSCLPAWMVPAHVTVVDRVPRTATGKVDRSALARRWTPPTGGPAPDRPRPAPTATERELRTIWQHTLGHEEIGPDDDFFALGGHSLLAVELFARIDQELGQDLPLSTLLDHPTIARLAVALDEHRAPLWPTVVPFSSDRGPWVVDGAPGGDHRPFFCVHGAGGNVLRLRELSAHVNRVRPFHAIQSPALDGRAFPFDTIEQMAGTYLEAVRRAEPVGPHLLGGFSMGGVVALEMGLQLAATGLRPALVVLIDSAPPGAAGRSAGGRPGPVVPVARPRLQVRRRSVAALDEVRVRTGRRVPVARRSAHMMRTGRRLVRAYRPARAFDGPALLVLSQDDPALVDGWMPLVPRLEVSVLPTPEHEALLDGPHAVRLAELIQDFVGRARWT